MITHHAAVDRTDVPFVLCNLPLRPRLQWWIGTHTTAGANYARWSETKPKQEPGSNCYPGAPLRTPALLEVRGYQGNVLIRRRDVALGV